MGNNQSNERRKNWKIYKITEKTISNNWIKFCLDDYVTYKDGNYKHIYFDKVFFLTRLQLLDFQKGIYVKIDLEKTRYEDNTHDFHVVMDDVMHTVRASGGTSETLANFGEVVEMLEARQQLIASIEQSHRANNHAWTKQTSWDMPPGWK